MSRTIPLLLLFLACEAHAALPKVRLTPVYPHLQFDRPLCITHANDGAGRLFVVEQAGRIHVMPDDPGTKQSSVFLDISERVRTAHNEEGLLALAFHPGYKDNGFFYIYYSASDPRRGVLSRFRVSPDNENAADPSSERVVLEVEQPYGNHNGATVLFGPDGYLYISLGDGGSAGDPYGNGQNLDALLGKILRLDVNRTDSSKNYAIPSDNPFVGVKGARPEVWAYGLRNVWRMSFDRQTGELWAGDVGQNKWEEIDIIVRGGNYGWNIREGMHPFEDAEPISKLIDPVAEYGRDDGASVTGGYVYRGSRFPALQGVYIYADYVTGTIWGLHHSDGRKLEKATLLEQPNNISSFGEDAEGEVLVTCFDGRVYRLESAP